MNEQMIKLLLLAEHPDIEIRVVPVVSGAQAVMGGEIIMFRFTDGLPLVCLDQGPVTLFLDDTEHVASCDEQLAAMAEAALDRGEPREMLARLASEFDSAEDSRDAIHHLAEEQPDGSCVEVAFAQVEAAIRDSKNPAGPSLSVSPGSWLVFTRRAAAGGRDLGNSVAPEVVS